MEAADDEGAAEPAAEPAHGAPPARGREQEGHEGRGEAEGEGDEGAAGDATPRAAGADVLARGLCEAGEAVLEAGAGVGGERGELAWVRVWLGRECGREGGGVVAGDGKVGDGGAEGVCGGAEGEEGGGVEGVRRAGVEEGLLGAGVEEGERGRGGDEIDVGEIAGPVEGGRTRRLAARLGEPGRVAQLVLPEPQDEISGGGGEQKGWRIYA